MMRVLVTGPYVGEIGWELMSWQARVRRVFETGGFDRLVVLGSAGRSAFYADMPLEKIVAANVAAKRNGHAVFEDFPLFEMAFSK